MKTLQLLAFAFGALALIVPKHVSPPYVDELVKRVDQPDNPRLGVDQCFRIEKVDEGQDFTECPPKNPLNDQGSCETHPNDCETYCEKTLKWGWGQEVPFDNARCGPGSCTLEERMQAEVSRSVTWGLQIGHGAFTAGASFSYSESKTTVSGVVRDKPVELEQDCGYWAFIPHTITSCGTTSKGNLDLNAFSGSKCKDVVEKEECFTTILETSQGIPSGYSVFVATDCSNPNERLPFCKQDEVYLKQGVSYDHCVFDEWKLAWTDMEDPNSGILYGLDTNCLNGMWPPSKVNPNLTPCQ
ncbi:hypothetical protein AK830_g10413 [Neonectria ditissima]|uniref:Uncharacterized protein n=1 Tax=Neonectria ditissima TaxID=78410 RepID=A0A0P7AFU5_9HYPO|nr:hypothetical protein AK830_g10413 [Neonectria ditissima]